MKKFKLKHEFRDSEDAPSKASTVLLNCGSDNAANCSTNGQTDSPADARQNLKDIITQNIKHTGSMAGASRQTD